MYFKDVRLNFCYTDFTYYYLQCLPVIEQFFISRCFLNCFISVKRQLKFLRISFKCRLMPYIIYCQPKDFAFSLYFGCIFFPHETPFNLKGPLNWLNMCFAVFQHISDIGNNFNAFSIVRRETSGRSFSLYFFFFFNV